MTQLMVFYKNNAIIGNVYISDTAELKYNTLIYGGIQRHYSCIDSNERLRLSYIMLYYVSKHALSKSLEYIRVLLPPIGNMKTVFDNILPKIINTDNKKTSTKQEANCTIHDAKKYHCRNIKAQSINDIIITMLNDRNVSVA